RNYQVYQAELAAARKQLRYLQEKFAVDRQVARERVKEAAATLTLARINLGYATITAPISGVVSLVSTQKGETVAASFNAPTFVNIIDLQRLQVVAYVDEADIGRVKLDQKVDFTVDACPETRFHGRVREVYPKAVVRNNVVSYEVMVEIDQPPAACRLRPEMSVYVTFVVATRERALLLPAEAVKLRHGKDIVYVRQGSGYVPREVTTGLVEAGKIEIVAGLKGGEQVVVAGFAALAAN
ncbi:MAG: efflux RND transporter periplasmic adaptor subunit, partial [Deltaproteobacteria bacterium]|nr:efflux RND transporter periplasmic adaptor subunit [Deltaproteobacteria bacterium]